MIIYGLVGVIQHKQLDISRCRQTINGLSMYAAAYPWSFEVNGHSKMAPKRVPENLDL